ISVDKRDHQKNQRYPFIQRHDAGLPDSWVVPKGDAGAPIDAPAWSSGDYRKPNFFIRSLMTFS
ncbi:MAG: hypothetical protein V3U44_08035, partial [Alphaproteobacteria bacterium]